MPQLGDHTPATLRPGPTDRGRATWAARIDRGQQGLADWLVAMAQRCTAADRSFATNKVLVLRVKTKVGMLNPIGIDPEHGVVIPWAIGPHKSASKAFAFTLAEALGADAYETPKTWAVRMPAGNRKRVNVTPAQLLAIEPQLRAALDRFCQEVGTPSPG